jgi:hypothetical protein
LAHRHIANPLSGWLETINKEQEVKQTRLKYYKHVEKLNDKEWVMLRLMFYILSTDVSSVTDKEIERSKDFVLDLFGIETTMNAFELIRKDQIARKAYDNPASWAMRHLRQSIQLTKGD